MPLRTVPKPAAAVRVAPAEGIKALEDVVTRRGLATMPTQRRGGGLLDWLALPRLFQRNS